jgi:N-dimethylarginine dimethylaminohydrolase
MSDSTHIQHLFPHKRWLVCRPVDYDVRYQINPWMDLTKIPEKALASAQWTNLHHHLIRLGAWIEYVHHEAGLPDMVFTANAGLVRGRDAVISRFRHKERQGEERHFRAWFEQNGFRVLDIKEGFYEGEGDSLFAGDRLFSGYGFRSDRAAHDQVATLLSAKELVAVELADARFYHLDTCFCPLTNKLAMFFPGAFTAEGIKALEKSIELLPVPADEATRFVCNAVVLGKDIVLPAGCPKTYELLKARGFESHPVELSEFIKAGGAAKCLSLRLEQL